MNKTKIAVLTVVVCLLSSCADAASLSWGGTKRKEADPKKIVYAESYSFEKLSSGETEHKLVSILLEAEDAEAAAGVAVKADTEGYSGNGYAEITDNHGFTVASSEESSTWFSSSSSGTGTTSRP